MNENTPPDNDAPDSPKASPGSKQEKQDLKQQAIKYKTFQHIFSGKDFDKNLTEKSISKKLKKSKSLERAYNRYLKALENNPNKKMIFPWDSATYRMLFWLSYWAPKVFKWGGLVVLVLFVINYIPGPTQHIIEVIVARAVYDTSPVQRLPETLETYAHSAKIVDSNGTIIKSYGKRQVTKQIPENVRKAILACEDHYLLPHKHNPWHVNTFLVHPGVSWINLFGAVKDTLFGKPRGASTIVMQNAKKILGNEERTIANKLEEIIIAYMMVSKFGKAKNLDFYINTVPVGSNIYGFPAAARNYFKKELNELDIQQLVTISAFIPNHYRQLAFYEIVNGKNFDELTEKKLFHAKEAMNKVNLALLYLRDLHEITEEEFLAWKLDSEESIRRIGFRDFRSPLYGEEEWTSWNVIKEVCSRNYNINGRIITGPQLILDERGDVVIETGVDLALVEKMKEIISEFLQSNKYRNILRARNIKTWEKDLERYQKRSPFPPYIDFDGFMDYLYRHINVGAAIVNRQGEIIAYVGGKEFLRGSDNNGSGKETEQSDVAREKNVIIDLMNKKAKTPPSSTIKPIIAYYTMVTQNTDLQASYPDKPLEYKYVDSVGKKIWLPRNWYNYEKPGTGKNRYLGRNYSLLEAQVQSVNTIFARLYSNRIIRNAMLIGFDEIGLEYNREDARYWPFGIGASNVPVQQWLGIYNAFLDGKYRAPSFVKRILINGKPVYERRRDPDIKPIHLFDAKKERENELLALYEVCNRGTGASMKTEFKYHKNLVSGKTGTAPENKSSLFVSHFNPYQDRTAHDNQTMTMIVAVTTNTGGYKSVGTSDQGPVKIAGRIYDYLFQKELRDMMDRKIENAKRTNIHFRNNHVYWANVNRYMEHLLNKKYNRDYIYRYIIGVDGYEEALEQILNSNNRIYSGKDGLFSKLVEYYCDQSKIVKMAPASAPDRKEKQAAR